MTIHKDMFDKPKESRMRGILLPITVKDLVSSHNLDLINKINKIWDENVGTDYLNRGSVILESVGGWLSQEAWEDQTGYHIQLRMAPLDAHRSDVQGRARSVIDAFVGLFPGGTIEFAENLEILNNGDVPWQEKESLGLTKTITVVVHTGHNSLGD